MPKDGAIETVDVGVQVDVTWTDEAIERLPKKRKRKLDLSGPVLVSPPRPRCQPVVTGNALFDAVSRPALVHRDFHFGNLLIASRLPGRRDPGLTVLDFEWAIFGDPEFDLVLLPELTRYFEGFEPEF